MGAGPNGGEDENGRKLLQQEADHFFQAELYHDQRASWLLALASALLTVTLGVLLAINEGKLDKSGRPLIMLAAGSFAGGILFGLFALWPLAGRDGTIMESTSQDFESSRFCLAGSNTGRSPRGASTARGPQGRSDSICTCLAHPGSAPCVGRGRLGVGV